MKVITWQSPSGQTMDICRSCEDHMMEVGAWPKDSLGQEYCTVSHGLHRGQCEVCDARDRLVDAAEMAHDAAREAVMDAWRAAGRPV